MFQPWHHPPVSPSGLVPGRLVLALTLALVGSKAFGTEPFAFDPVAELRQALRMPIRDPSPRSPDLELRRSTLDRCVALLCGAPDLREALLLQEWHTEAAADYVLLIDQAARTAIARRFEQTVLDTLQRGDPAGQLAALNMLAEMAPTLRDTQLPGWTMRGFTPALADLARSQTPELARAAVRALGRINADPLPAISALADLACTPEPPRRCLGVGALADLVGTAEQGLYRHQGTPGETTRLEVLHLCRLVVPVACGSLGDPDPGVRYQGIEALHHAVGVSRKLLTDPVLGAPDQAADQGNAQLMALASALKDQTAGLTAALQDPVPAVRLRAHQTLEEIGALWMYLDGRERGANPGSLAAPPVTGPLVAQSLRQRLHAALPSLSAGVADPDVRVRRAAVEALETLETEAAPAVPALTRALADPDLFVRWAAARTLGKMAPVQPGLVVPGLQERLHDRDLDVRLAAAAALKRYGPAAQAALPALMETVQRGDAGVRLAALEVLESIGTPAQAAIPAIAVALRAPDVRVRQAAARLLGRFGPLALDARESLRLAMGDGSPEVRQAASDALLHIGPPPERVEALARSPEVPPKGNAPSPANPGSVIWRASHSIPAPPRHPLPQPALEPRQPAKVLPPSAWHAAPPVPTWHQLAQTP